MMTDEGRSPDGPGQSGQAPEPSGLGHTATVPSAWCGEADGSVIGYMCLTDWEFELGAASGGNGVYPSVADLKRHRKCVESCGIVEVRVSCSRIIQPANERWDNADAPKGSQP